MSERLSIPIGTERIVAALHLPRGLQAPPCVVASHGLAASKDSDKYLQLAESLSRVGIACCRYDSRGSGESNGRYAETTVGRRIEDLRAVLRYLRALPLVDPGRLGLFGSSLGGFVSYFAAREDAVSALVTWATPASLWGMERLNSEEARSLGPAFFAEIAEGKYAEAPENVTRLLLIHGDRDDLVPVDHAKQLWERAAEPKRLLIVEGADHRFSDPGLRGRAMDETVKWFLHYLRG